MRLVGVNAPEPVLGRKLSVIPSGSLVSPRTVPPTVPFECPNARCQKRVVRREAGEQGLHTLSQGLAWARRPPSGTCTTAPVAASVPPSRCKFPPGVVSPAAAFLVVLLKVVLSWLPPPGVAPRRRHL